MPAAVVVTATPAATPARPTNTAPPTRTEMVAWVRSYLEACTTPENLMPTALEIARTIASKSPISTRMGKHTLNVIEDMSLRDGYRYEQDMTAAIGKTDDAREAQAAFREKRSPVFTGR